MHRQRGAISIIAAATLVVSVLIVALALDIGRIVLEKQRLQAAADAAAMAGARVLAVKGDRGDARAAARAAAQHNGLTAALADSAIEVGRLAVKSGLRQFESGEPYNAVRVQTTRSVPRSLFAGGLLPGQTVLSARAVAYQESMAGLQVGSSLASLNPPLLNAVLGGLLGDDALDLSVADYNGLLGAQVKVGDLLAGLNIGGVDALAGATVGVDELFRVTADVLTSDKPGAATTARLALNNKVITRIGAIPDIVLGDLLTVSTEEASLNVLELVKASAQLARKNPHELIDIDLSTAGALPSGLGGVTLQLGVVQAPQLAEGRPGYHPDTHLPYTKARTGQVNMGIRLNVADLPLVLKLLVSNVVVNLDLSVASAEAELVSITPATPGGSSSVEIAALARPADLDVDVSAKLLIGLIPVSATAGASLGSNTKQVLTFDGPFVPTLESPSDDNTQTVGSGAGLSISNLQLTLAGVTLPLGNLLGGLLNPLVNDLLTPLLQQLGLQIGGADVTVLHASAGEVRLVQ